VQEDGGSPLLEDGTETLDTEVTSPKGLGFASNSIKNENFAVNEDMAFDDERELEQDPEMKDIYFLKSSLTQQEPQQKVQRRGLGIIGNDSATAPGRQGRSTKKQPYFEE